MNENNFGRFWDLVLSGVVLKKKMKKMKQMKQMKNPDK
jgi:hypothetical protein